MPSAPESIFLVRALRNPHPAVTATREAVRYATQRDDGQLEIHRLGLVAQIVVTREQVHAALLLLQTVLKEADRRGYRIVEVSGGARSTGVAIEIRRHGYPIKITELTDRVPMTRDRRDVPRAVGCDLRCVKMVVTRTADTA